MSWQGFKEKPIFGWGPENFNLVFNKYYEPILWKQEPWFDRAHNVFLDRLTTGGFFGLLTYLSLFAFAFYYLWFPWKKKNFSRSESIILTSMFAAYFFHNLFVFDNLISSLFFIAFLAYINTKFQQLPQEKKTMSISTNLGLKSASALIIVIFTIFIVYYVNVPGILASRDLIKALGFSSKGDLQSSFSAFQKALSRNSFGSSETREQLSSFAQQILPIPGLDNNFKQKAFDFTVSEMKKQSNQSPNDIRYMVFLGVIYNKAGQYDEAIDILQKAIKLSSKKQQLYFELGTSYLNKGEYVKGFEILKKSFELDPEFFEARKIYAVAAIFAGKDGLAEELMKDYGGTIVTDERFLTAFNERKMFDKVAAIWEKFVEENPENAQYRVSLAASYLQVEKRQKAIEQLQKAIELEPRFKQQGEYYIKEIQAGRNP
jgi:tetratricopeptide (TPR) repeat protein